PIRPARAALAAIGRGRRAPEPRAVIPSVAHVVPPAPPAPPGARAAPRVPEVRVPARKARGRRARTRWHRPFPGTARGKPPPVTASSPAATSPPATTPAEPDATRSATRLSRPTRGARVSRGGAARGARPRRTVRSGAW